MKKLTLLLFTLLIATGSIFAQSAGDKILGTWLNEEKDGKIEIYKSGSKYFGKLVWGKNMYEPDGSSRTDIKNPDPKLRSRKLQDLVLLTNFTYDDGEWEGGKIYDPKSGKTYSCVMKFKGNILQIKGYIGITLLGRTTTWTKA
ncbi:DUF2147 domain-containing protein [Chitinophaga filiformis]|uniref:DUF2147 domain-containing protein n=1 Tax=Chitinophaga filiformis TaxID=104663 RepID=A0ABY4HY56_CHIFI|nr:DUF2147 domain-containing protein [Chitinophaga filiformis]UPK68751.1 DUF2147 domain-containing protein [Chitinophaga filiformis]